MKGILLLIFLMIYHPLLSMDDSNIFDIDSDELRELKEIAESLESPGQIIAQEQKESYQKSDNTHQQTKSKQSKDKKKIKEKVIYTCSCGGEYLVHGWFKRHQAGCFIAKHQQ